MGRGTLRVYLGAAPGVGKTYAMLDEGHRRAGRGTDVVVAVVETHGRQRTAAMAEGLEVVPRRRVEHRGGQFEELDLDAVLARRPALALVDELAHTNVPGSGRHEKRWQDVEELLEAGIDVLTTVNVQHLESLNDVVERITGVPQRETVPDAVVRAAEQVQLVDMTPEALRRRLAHGNVYAADKVEAALGNWFRVGNLAALRELALLWLADAVEEGLRRYRDQHDIDTPWETRERVVVALTGGPEGEVLLRRGARIAARNAGELLAVHVARSDGLAGAGVAALQQQRLLAEKLGGSYHSVVGDDVAAALLEFARGRGATQVVVGASRRPWLVRALTGPGTSQRVIDGSGAIDVHVVTHEEAGRGTLRAPGLTGGLTARRRWWGLALALGLLPLVTLLCAQVRPELTLPSDMLLHLSAVVVVALVGGLYPALVAAVGASLLLNWYFTPPLYTFTISAPENVLALGVFVAVAVAVSSVVDLAARRTRAAAAAGAEAEALTALAGSVLRGERGVTALLDRVREAFGQDSVALLRRDSAAPGSSGESLRGSWTCVASVGPDPCLQPGGGDAEVPLGAGGDDDRGERVLVLRGRPLSAGDQRVLAGFAAQVAVAAEQARLAAAAADAETAREADRVRTALLAAVSHDLRTPLASAKAAVSSLRATDVTWTTAEQQQLLGTADGALDRLTAVVDDLLEVSRLQAGVVAVQLQPTDAADVVARALDVAAPGQQVLVDVPEDLPPLLADPGLLERVLANLVQNALRHSPSGSLPLVVARPAGGGEVRQVALRVVDQGPGIAADDRERVFAAFQRLGDTTADGAGVGLGLAIARGLTESMGGTLEPGDTPGGGLTMVVTLPAAAAPAAYPPAGGLVRA